MENHHRSRLFHLLWITVWIMALVDLTRSCPSMCTCNPMKDKEDEAADGQPGQKVVCRSELTSLAQLEMDLISEDTVQLDLSGNALTFIEKDTFQHLDKLKKLDLSENQISRIEFGAFLGLDSLIKLDLSKNSIGFMNGSTFEGMPALQRLYLGSNSIRSLPEGSFDVLPTLTRIDFESDELVCDCRLQWMVKWQKTSKTRVLESTKCAQPSELEGTAVRTLKRKDLHCDWPVELDLFELTPSSNQVVFQGDKLPFECRASVPDSATKMFWVREDRPLENNKSQGIYIHEQSLSDHTLIKRLVLDDLRPKHSGVWKCRVETPHGSVDKSVNIIVISEDTLYCPQNTTQSNKGTYVWPKTVQGVRIDLPCENGEATGYQGKSVAKAYHSCNAQVKWEDLDESRCQYASRVTRLLEQYAEHDLTNMTTVVSKANQLNRYISNPKTLTDKMDIVYTSKIVEAFSKLARDNEKLGDIVLHIVSSLMDADADLLREAQLEEKACTRLIKAVEELPKQLLIDQNLTKKYTKNIVLEAYKVAPDTFPGMTCASYRPSDPGKANTYMEDSFHCSMRQNYTAVPVPKEGQEIETSIHIPDTIFKDARCLYQICQRDNLAYKIQVVVYKNAKLFPLIGDNLNAIHLSSGVVSSKIAGVSVINTTNPVIVNLRDVDGTKGKKAVYWDFMANDGMGAWLNHGCQVMGRHSDLTEIHCTRLNHVALIKTASLGASQMFAMFVQFFTLSVVVYVGTGIITLCMMAVIITYLCVNRKLKMPRKAKHSIANLCLAIMLLFVTYALGIKTREPLIACQIIGIAIHYFSLSVLFWITIIAFFMCKKFAKAAYPPPPPVEPLDGPPPPRTVVTVYLVGWGVSIIICGISGAINWFNYAGNADFCFLSVGAGVLCFYIPVGLLVVIDFVLFIRIACILRGSSDKTLEPIDEPETEETQVNVVELADNEGSIVVVAGPSRDTANESVAATEKTHMTTATTSSSSSKMDVEYRPINQLHATIVLLLLYMLTWTAGALVVALPFHGIIPHQEIIFNYLFGGLAIVLGVYVFVFYCVGRTECRKAWRQFCCCVPKTPDRAPTPDTTSNLAQLPLANGHIHSGSDMEGSSYTSKSNQTNSFRYTPKKTSNVNLVPSITEPSMCSIQELQQRFYNPRQNGAAKKYWEKNKQHRLLHQFNADLYLDSGHSSHGEGRPTKRSNRDSFPGNSSDANTHLSIEIQIQPKQGPMSPHSSTEQNQNIYNSLQRRQLQKSPVNLDYQKPLLTLGPLIERNQIPPVGGTSSPPPSYNNKYPYNNPHNVNIYPLLTPPHMAGIDYASSGSSHTLPKHLRDNKLPVQEGMQRNGSVPRLRDFDGQSAVSSEQTTQTPSVGLADVYQPPRPVVVDYTKKEPAGRSQQATPENELPEPKRRSVERNSNSRGSSLDKNSNSKNSHEQTDNFLDQLEQRIPQSQNTAPDKLDNASLGENNHNGGHVDQVEQLPPTATESHDLPGSSGRKSHRKHHRHHGKRHSRMSREPKSWDEEFKDRPPKPSVNYAFVNHDYRDRVIDKLIKTNAETGLLEKGLLDPNLSWMPRSVSAYDHQDAAESLLDSSSESSSDQDSEDMGDVWVLQKKKKKKFKKETSV